MNEPAPTPQLFLPLTGRPYLPVPDRQFWTPSGLPVGYLAALKRHATPSGLPRPFPDPTR